MKIEGKSNVVMNVYMKNVSTLNNNKVSGKGTDRIEISNMGKEISKFIEEYKDIELANDKLQEIATKVKNGKYVVDDEKLAKSILKDIKRGE